MEDLFYWNLKDLPVHRLSPPHSTKKHCFTDVFLEHTPMAPDIWAGTSVLDTYKWGIEAPWSYCSCLSSNNLSIPPTTIYSIPLKPVLHCGHFQLSTSFLENVFIFGNSCVFLVPRKWSMLPNYSYCMFRLQTGSTNRSRTIFIWVNNRALCASSQKHLTKVCLVKVTSFSADWCQKVSI